MPGTAEGGKLAAETNRKRWGKDFYAKIGAMGGKKGRTGGFYADRELAREAGSKGGRLSKVGKKLVGYDENDNPIYIKTEEYNGR